MTKHYLYISWFSVLKLISIGRMSLVGFKSVLRFLITKYMCLTCIRISIWFLLLVELLTHQLLQDENFKIQELCLKLSYLDLNQWRVKTKINLISSMALTPKQQDITKHLSNLWRIQSFTSCLRQLNYQLTPLLKSNKLKNFQVKADV